jgi:guanine nucleotide-binding protein G(I)/G(S)/G(T) subunit beta-1
MAERAEAAEEFFDPVAMEEAVEDARSRVEALKSRIEALEQTKRNGTLHDVLRTMESPEPSSAAAVCTARTFDKFMNGMSVRRKLHSWSRVNTLHWSAIHPNRLITAEGGELIVWDAMKEARVQRINTGMNWNMTCCLEPTLGALAAIGGLSNCIKIYRVAAPQQTTDNLISSDSEKIQMLDQHDGYVSCARFINEDRLVSTGGDGMVILWDVERGCPTQLFNHDAYVMSVSVSPTNVHLFVTGSCDCLAKVWDMRQSPAAFIFEGHEADINAVKFMPDGHSFVTASDDATSRLFDLRSFSELNRFEDFDVDVCTSVDTSISGRLVFVGANKGMCYVWDTLEGSKIAQLDGHDGIFHIICLGVNATGEALCTAPFSGWPILNVWA